MQRRPRSGPAPVRVLGPALVLVLGRGAERAARRAFRAGEVLSAGDDPSPRLAEVLLVAVPVEEPDAATLHRLAAAAQHEDRPVDAVLLGLEPAPSPQGRLLGVTFRSVTQVPGTSFTVERLPATFDRRDLTGPFDVIGDVHGCLEELLLLLARLGYEVRLDGLGRPDGAHHPEGRTPVFVGDLVDRGPDVAGVLRLLTGMLASGQALSVIGNHDDTLRRALLGHDVEPGRGLQISLEQLGAEPEAFRQTVADLLGALPAHLLLDGGRLVVAHAGLAERWHGRESARVRALCLFGPTTGETDEHGQPVRLPWADDYRGAATVVYGHTPTTTREWRNGTACVDGGCVTGGALVAVRYPERTFVEVPAAALHSAPQSATAPATAPAAR